MRLALEELVPAQVPIEIIDVDDDPALLARYDELVPVLMGRHPDGTLQELCHYFLDSDAVVAFISKSTTIGPAS